MDRQQQYLRAQLVLSNSGIDVANAKVMDRTHYLTFDAAGKGSIVEILDSNTRKLVGVTSFDANKFNKGRFFVLDAIRVLVESTASKVEEATWKGTTDKAVINSELTFSQDEELITLPVSDLLVSEPASLDFGGFRNISSSPVLVPEKEIHAKWTFPNGTSVASSTQLVRIELRGFEFFMN